MINSLPSIRSLNQSTYGWLPKRQQLKSSRLEDTPVHSRELSGKIPGHWDNSHNIRIHRPKRVTIQLNFGRPKHLFKSGSKDQSVVTKWQKLQLTRIFFTPKVGQSFILLVFWYTYKPRTQILFLFLARLVNVGHFNFTLYTFPSPDTFFPPFLQEVSHYQMFSPFFFSLHFCKTSYYAAILRQALVDKRNELGKEILFSMLFVLKSLVIPPSDVICLIGFTFIIQQVDLTLIEGVIC